MMATRPVIAVLAVLTAPGILAAQGEPLGPEFRVNTYTTSTQYRPSVASDAAGNFIVLWESFDQDGSSFGIFAQRYDSGGSPLGGEFRVNTHTAGTQSRPSAAHDPAGTFVVAWQSYGPPGVASGIFAQRYSSTGAPLAGEFRVNTRRISYQREPAVASDPAGDIVIVWQAPENASSLGIFARRYDSAGAPLGGEFRVNTYTTGTQYLPAVASDAAGSFVVAWVHKNPANSEVFAQRFASTGDPLGPEFRVNTSTTGTQFWPSVACDPAGNFVVTWYGYVPGGNSFDVIAQRFSATGAPLGGEFRVNTYATGAQWFPMVASDDAGNFVVVWEGEDASASGIFGQRYDGTGVPLGPEFRVNTYTTNQQLSPSLAADSSGNFVVVWFSPDGNNSGVFGQRFGTIASPAEAPGVE